MKKQAYLIVAHKCDKSFLTLLRMLDHPRNDIFIHMDKKNKLYDEASVEKLMSYSPIRHTKRTKVSWGAYSMINAELLLLELATSVGVYEHYHLLSGEDLPIKKQDIITSFFEQYTDKEFVAVNSDIFTSQYRTRYYHFFREVLNKKGHNIVRAVNKVVIKIQQFLGVYRNQNINFQKGSQWFSITDGFARYVITQKAWIRKVFRYTFLCDEVFMQTIIINSPFANKLYDHSFREGTNKNARLIDWKRGKPYVFQYGDLEEIIESDRMFARKFNADIDSEIIEAVENLFGRKEQQ